MGGSHPREQGCSCWLGKQAAGLLFIGPLLARTDRDRAKLASKVETSFPSAACESGRTPSTSSRQAPQRNILDGSQVLKAVLAIERRCLGEQSLQDGDAEEEFDVECMLDEPDKKYFLCSSLSSSSVIVYFWLRLEDVRLADVHEALVNCKLRQARDVDSEYVVHREAHPGDPTREEDYSCVMRAPWPFQDRDSLQRRWQLHLPAQNGRGDGVAIVMRSFDDPELLPHREDRVRAFVNKSANLLRHLGQEPGLGLELATCQSVDLGGSCPAWAQKFITRFAVNRGVQWGQQLREYCLCLAEARQTTGSLEPSVVGEEQDDPARRRESLKGDETSKARRRCGREPMSGQEVLAAILAIEDHCRWATCEPAPVGNESTLGLPVVTTDPGSLSVECLLNEPSAKMCLCGSLDSPIVTGYIRVDLADVYPSDVFRALMDKEERIARDPDSEYQVLRNAADGDPTLEEDISFVMRAPWPFWDRDVLQRRWTFPLGDEDSGCVAIVMRSIDDDSMLPEHAERVRAFVHNMGYLLRPKNAGKGLGLEIAVCQQVDYGGICPEWAQDMLTRLFVHRGKEWAEELREHCNRQAKRLRSGPSSSSLHSQQSAGCAIS